MEKERNYRITIIVKDEVIVEKFSNEHVAKDTMSNITNNSIFLFVSSIFLIN
jgi:3D (Asp-Asp-Asp) domain-containing protein